MKCNEYQVLCDCVERGVALGWQRAHKHHDQPSAEAIGASIEQAVLLAIGDYFVFDDDRDADRGNTSDHFADAGKMVHQFEDARGMVATSQESRQVEPVAWMTHGNDLLPLFHKNKQAALGWGENPRPLYTAPPKREPLTEEEIVKMWQAIDHGKIGHTIDFARAIERAHGIGAAPC